MKHLLNLLNPFSIKITRAGFIYTLLTIFLGISAVNTGNNLLFTIVSVLLSFMWLSGVFSRANLSGLTLRVISTEDLFAEEEGKLWLELRKEPGFLPVFLLRIRAKIVSENGGKIDVYERVAHFRREILFALRFTPERRGRFFLETIEISSLFPMGLFIRKKTFKLNHEMVVFPKPIKCSFPEALRRTLPQKALQGYTYRGVQEFERLGEYHPGVPMRFISWRSFAKWDDPKRKIFVEGDRKERHIVVERLPFADLESKLSCATYLILLSVKERLPLIVTLGGRTYFVLEDGSGKRQILRELALYGKD